MKKNKKFNILAILSFLIISIFITFKIFQNDTLYAIKVGELILKNGIDMLDHFSVIPNLPYTYPHWLYDVIVYQIHHYFGFTGLYIMNMVCLFSIATMLYYIMKYLTKNKLFSYLLTLATTIALQNFVVTRAQSFSYILLLLEFLLLEYYHKSKDKRALIGLFVIMYAIFNIHMAVFPVFFVIYLPFIFEAFISKYKNNIGKYISTSRLIFEENKQMLKTIFIIPLTIIVGFFTPLGTVPFTYIVNQFQGSTLSSISEHMPMGPADESLFLVPIIILLIIVIGTKMKFKVRDLCFIFGFTMMSLISRRHFSFLLLFGSICLCRTIANYVKEKDPHTSDFIINKIVSPIGIIAFIGISFYLGFTFKGYEGKYLEESYYPTKATKFIKENLDYKNDVIFNDYNFGSYLIYKDIPVFIDSRSDLYTPEFNKMGLDIYNEASTIRLNYQKTFEKYNIRYIFVYKSSDLSYILPYDKKYSTIYEDKFY